MRWNRTLTVVDAHCEGEIGRVITGGVGQVPGETMFDKKIWLERNRDDIRQMVLYEPRGGSWHNANIILPSNNPKAAMGYVILEVTEYPAMSGTNTICVTTVLLETGILPMKEPVTELTLESPNGLIDLRCECKDGKVTSVAFTNQPAFVYYRDTVIQVPKLGPLRLDIVFGGMTYVMVESRDLGFEIEPSEAADIRTIAQIIKHAAVDQLPVSYPGNPDMPGITNFVLMGPVHEHENEVHARNTVIVSPGRCDRSPCGTGTSARMALMHARGILKPGQKFVHESIIGTKFYCSIKETCKLGPYEAVVPIVSGQAWITGIIQMGMDPSDPFQHGYTLNDTWHEDFPHDLAAHYRANK